MGGTEELRRVLEALARGPGPGADALDAQIARLTALRDNLLAQAAALRASPDAPPGTRSEGGTGDRVRMRVVGPDGTIKATAEAGHG